MCSVNLLPRAVAVKSFCVSQCSGGRPLAVKRVSESINSMTNKHRVGFFQEVSMMWSLRDRSGFVKLYARLSLLNGACLSGTSILEARAVPYTQWRLINMFMQYCDGIGYMHLMGLPIVM